MLAALICLLFGFKFVASVDKEQVQDVAFNFLYIETMNPNFPTSLILSLILQLKALLADSERSKLLRRLSEANQYNRFLKRQVIFGAISNNTSSHICP